MTLFGMVKMPPHATEAVSFFNELSGTKRYKRYGKRKGGGGSELTSRRVGIFTCA